MLAVIKVRRFGPEQLEYDFGRMRRADTWRTGEGFWGKKMDALLGQYLTPTVLLCDSEAEARLVAAAVRQAMTVPPLLGWWPPFAPWKIFSPPTRPRAQRDRTHPQEADAQHPRRR